MLAPLGGRADHPAKWVLLKDDERAKRFIIRHGPLFQDNKGACAAVFHSTDHVCDAHTLMKLGRSRAVAICRRRRYDPNSTSRAERQSKVNMR